MDLKSILGPSAEDASQTSASNSESPLPPALTRHLSHPVPQLPRQQQQQQPPPALHDQQRSGNPSRAFTQRTHSGPIIPQISSRQNASPLSQASIPSVLPAHVLSPLVQGASSPLISPVPGGAMTPQGPRTPSTPSMDTLADLASMQTHQPMRPPLFKAGSLESNISADSARLAAIADATLTSNPRASFDINMLETAKVNVRTDFSHSSLPESQRNQLNELAVSLQQHPSAYQYHVELINILHQGFTNHVYPSAAPDSRRDPATYDLLPELRAARDAMEKLFAVGEALWLDWLQDESLLAQSADERIAVVEKCRRAVDDEVGSVKLWSVYGDWVSHCYSWANSPSNEDAVDEEKLVGREIFNSQLVLDVWHQAVDATANDLHSSHVVWKKYLNFRVPDNQQRLDKEQATLCLQLFEQRLTQPHAQWDDTFQLFSTFVSANMPPEQYESIMMDTSKVASPAKKMWADRESFELALEKAQQNGDRDAEYNTFVRYLDWELTPEKKRPVNLDLCNALYQRAELRFPSEATIWEDHVACMLETSIQSLGLLDRATRHCSWSGSLWSQYLLASDRLGHSFQETERIKHRATSTGVLEAAGIEEVLKVHAAWCSYLRRRAFQADGDEDDTDIAEIGIRASMESISSLGAKLGIGEAPDSSFRLQRIYINFLTKCGRWDNARHELDNAMRDYGRSYEFWSYFYRWEMMRWRRFEPRGDNSEANETPAPHLATAVLKQALDQPNLDYPEPIIQLFISHCEDNENADELQSALLKVRKVQKALVARRQIEAVQAAQASAVYKHEQESGVSVRYDGTLNKRKREDDTEDDSKSDVNKRNKNGDFAVETVEQPPAEHPKRDREHATILVENLPEKITDTRIRQYFSSCGTVKAVKLLEGSESAVVEFDTDDEAHYALSRDGQQLDEAIISVTLDTGSTVFLANYKADADEAYLRELLDSFGEIISIRLPSLQGNKRRRFCYVQFKLPSEAQAAVNSMDGHKIDDLTLSCKISNPAVKQSRQVNVNDGRTVFVGGIHFSAKEEEVEAAFRDFGEIIRVRMPLHETMKNRNKGIAFVTFSSIESAEKALQMSGQKIRDRPVNVKIATNERAKDGRQGSEMTHDRRSRTPAERQETQNGHMTSASSAELPDRSTREQRTIFLSNIADTVNEARLRSLGAQFGTVIKAVLKTEHQGAFIEYETPAAAGDAALKLDGVELSGRPVRIVSEAEMKELGPEIKTAGFKTTTATKPLASGTAFVKRPAQPGNRPRKGGNLGQRSALLHSAGTSRDRARADDTTMDETDSADTAAASGKKSNDDFRALLAGKKE